MLLPSDGCSRAGHTSAASNFPCDDIRVGLLLRIQASKDLRLHPRAPGCSIVWVETVSVSGVQSRKEWFCTMGTFWVYLFLTTLRCGLVVKEGLSVGELQLILFSSEMSWALKSVAGRLGQPGAKRFRKKLNWPVVRELPNQNYQSQPAEDKMKLKSVRSYHQHLQEGLGTEPTGHPKDTWGWHQIERGCGNLWEERPGQRSLAHCQQPRPIAVWSTDTVLEIFDVAGGLESGQKRKEDSLMWIKVTWKLFYSENQNFEFNFRLL